MASIQCAIELYDGVSPVLAGMSTALDTLCAGFAAFDGSINLSFDEELLGMAAASDSIYALADSVVLLTTYQKALNSSILAGSAQFGEFSGSALLATEAVNNMASESMVIFDGLGSYIGIFASGLPGYFVAPLNTIAGLFQTMAASARSSLASISSAASATVASVRSAASSVKSAVSAMNNSLSSVSVASASTGVSAYENSAAVSTLSVFSQDSLSDSGAVSSVLSADAVSVMMLQDGDSGVSGADTDFLYLGAGDRQTYVQPVINVQVSNENHISSQVDADAVLREFEYRLVDAVQSCAEGVLL